MPSMFFWKFLIKAVTLQFEITLHSEIRDVHQLNADVDYFFRAKKHSEIRDKQSYLVN